MRRTASLFLYAILSGTLLGLPWILPQASLLLFIAWIPLLIIDDAAHKKGKYLWGFSYLTFFVWNLIATWWLSCVSEPLPTKILSVAVPIICNSLFMLIFFFLFQLTKRKMGNKTGYLSLIFYWITFEFLHHNWELAWPWLTLGNGFSGTISFIQWYEYTGVLGGSMWILIANLLFFKVYKKIERSEKNLLTILQPTMVVLIPLLISIIMFHTYKELGVQRNVIVVQPNIDPYQQKYDKDAYDHNLRVLINLAKVHLDTATNYIVGPETAIVSGIWENNLSISKSIKTIRSLTDSFPNSKYVLGISSYLHYASSKKPTPTARKLKRKNDNGWYDAFNTAIQISSAKNYPVYHKSKLVPGVERMPYPEIFSFLEKYALDFGGIIGSLGMQDERTVFFDADSTIGIAPIICFESTYGEYVTEFIKNGAQLIFVMTNDGWWKDTPGYKSHLRFSSLRAIETRKSVVRSANTGISCFVNQRGEIITPTLWDEAVSIKGTVYANNKLTFYSLYGDYLGRLSLMMTILSILFLFVKISMKKK